MSSPVEIVQFAHTVRKRYLRWQADRRLDAARLGRESKLLGDLLSNYYPTFARPWADLRYPVVVFEVPKNQTNKPESILGSLADDTMRPDSWLLRAGEQYVNSLRAVGRPLEDLPTYVLREMNLGAAVTLDCARGTYFDALRTCDLLEWELLAELAEVKPELGLQSVLGQLKCRNYIHYLSKQPVTDPAGRSAAIAISTVVLFRDRDGYKVLLQERSNLGAAVHGDLFHVVPSGMFQPVVQEWSAEYSVTHNVFREYLEELFCVKEVAHPRSIVSVDYFYDNRNLKFLRSLIGKGDARLLLTGLAVNLLNLRPEICTLLYINSPDWFEKHRTGSDGLDPIELNEEWQASGKSGVGAKPWSWITRQCPPSVKIAPAGAAALYLATRTVEQEQLLRSVRRRGPNSPRQLLP